MPLFISDLHLHPDQPQTAAAFLGFLRRPARDVDGLYILGDLFDLWLGDDVLAEPFNAEMAAALAELAATGVAIHYLHGNRDFLIGAEFAAAAKVNLLPEVTLIDLAGTPTVLCHGDTLCTDDTVYQDFRRQYRTPAWMAGFLAQPLAVRRELANRTRQNSNMAKVEKDEAIMDVNAGAVAELLRSQGATRLIHGHTHRPARHALDVDGRPCERWVLAEWHNQATWLECDATGCRPRSL